MLPPSVGKIRAMRQDQDVVIPSPMRTRLDWLVAFPSCSWKVNVPSSAGVKDSMVISITPVFLSKFILYFCKTKRTAPVYFKDIYLKWNYMSVSLTAH